MSNAHEDQPKRPKLRWLMIWFGLPPALYGLYVAQIVARTSDPHPAAVLVSFLGIGIGGFYLIGGAVLATIRRSWALLVCAAFAVAVTVWLLYVAIVEPIRSAAADFVLRSYLAASIVAIGVVVVVRFRRNDFVDGPSRG